MNSTLRRAYRRTRGVRGWWNIAHWDPPSLMPSMKLHRCEQCGAKVPAQDTICHACRLENHTQEQMEAGPA